MKNILKQIKGDSTPLLIAIALAIFSVIASLIFNIELGLNYLFGVIAIIISTYTYFADKKIYRYFFGVVLILGILNYLNFSAFQAYFSIGNPPWISLNPIFFILLIFHLFFSSKKYR